jgi:hypothetical protein
VNRKFGDAIARRLNVAEQASLEPLDPGSDDASNRGIRQAVEPCGELGECLAGGHGEDVIGRLPVVNRDRVAGPAVPGRLLATAGSAG